MVLPVSDVRLVISCPSALLPAATKNGDGQGQAEQPQHKDRRSKEPTVHRSRWDSHTEVQE